MRRPINDPTWAEAGFHLPGPGADFATYAGTSGNDTFVGTAENDTIDGDGGNDVLSGGDGDDVIRGGDGNDSIAGDGDDDILAGGDGSDTITSTSGADTVDGGAGYDRWNGDYRDTASSLTFDEASLSLSNGTTLSRIESIQLTTGSGDDTINLSRTSLSRSLIAAGAGIDTLTFNADPSSSRYGMDVKGFVQEDGISLSLQGAYLSVSASGLEHVSVTGTNNKDLFIFSRQSLLEDHTITIDGAGGKDLLSLNLSALNSIQFVARTDGSIDSSFGQFSNLERFHLVFGGGSNVVTLGKSPDRVSSAGSGDRISTGGGADTIYERGTGATIDGGSGYDKCNLYLYNGVVYNQSSGVFSDGTTITGIEYLYIYSSFRATQGSVFNIDLAGQLYIFSQNVADHFYVDLSGLTSGLSIVAGGNLLNWTLSFGETTIAQKLSVAPETQTLSLIGTSGNDTFDLGYNGTDYIDSVVGGDGFDSLKIFTSSIEFVVNEDGTITSSRGSFAGFEQFDVTVIAYGSTVDTGAGDDIINGASSTGENYFGGAGGDDVITGGSGTDHLTGGDGDDVLKGGSGTDTLNGGAGDDNLDGGDGIDTASYFRATAGVTVTITSSVQDTIGAGHDLLSSIENLTGSDFDDTLTGDGGANVLRGIEGDDVLSGLRGADILMGGAGADRLSGGGGADVFAFVRLADSAPGAKDVILDFSSAEHDRIDLSAIDPQKGGVDQAFSFIGDEAFSGSGVAEVRVEASGQSQVLVEADADGDGQLDFALLVTTAQPLTAADFVL